MNFTEQQLTEIEEMGSCFFSPRDVAIFLQVEIQLMKEQLEDPNTSAYQSYERGRLRSELTVRKSIVDLAGRGSSQAQEMVMKYIMDSNLGKTD